MDTYKDELVTAGIGELYSQYGKDLEDMVVYGHVWVIWLEGWDYHSFISELDAETNVGFAFVSWHENERGYINLDEYKTLPVMLQEVYHGWVKLKDLSAYKRIKKRE